MKHPQGFRIDPLFFSIALFSELREFSKMTEPNAIALLLGGGMIVGGSLVMSILMMVRDTSVRMPS